MRKLKFRLLRNCGLVCLLFIGACQPKKNPDIPENAIDPGLVKNPVSASPKGNTKEYPVFQFEMTTHDFGTVTEGEKVSFAFPFKNVGKAVLLIRAAQGSCGCTVPEFPKDPIEPGGTGIINVTFNSEGKTGAQNKTITVISNTNPNTFMLSITGNVLKAE